MTVKTQTTLAVEGMSCPSCISHIDEALKDLDGVEAVEVKLKEGKVSVVHAERVARSELIEALRDAGYESRAA